MRGWIIMGVALVGLGVGGCHDRSELAPIPAAAADAHTVDAIPEWRWVTFSSPAGTPLLGQAEARADGVVEVRLEGSGVVKRVPEAEVTPVPQAHLAEGARVWAFIGCGSARPMLREAVVTEVLARGAGYRVDGITCKGQEVHPGWIVPR